VRSTRKIATLDPDEKGKETQPQLEQKEEGDLMSQYPEGRLQKKRERGTNKRPIAIRLGGENLF